MNKKYILNNILGILKDSSIILLVFIITIILISNILFLCHISITNMNFAISVFVTILFVLKYYRNKKTSNVVLSVLIAVIVFAISICICSKTYDLSWDGNTYHKLEIGMLKDGWNPVYENAREFIDEDINKMGLIDDDKNSIWIEHYPKASWVFASNIYCITNDIETSKIINLLMMYICFTIILNYLNKKISLIFATIIALLLSVNPISVVQTFNFYIDGLMGLCLYLILYALVALTDSKEEDKKTENRIILSISIILCVNLKFTGLVYAGFFCLMFFVFWLYKDYKKSRLKEKIIEYFKFYIIVLIVSICIVGFTPYIKNIITKGNPLYPLIGKGKIDIITHNQPINFKEKNAMDKFCISLFGVGENILSSETDRVPTFKYPFTFTEQELQQYWKTDIRISGFGVLFSGIFIISIIILIIKLYQLYKCDKKEEFTICLAFIFVTIILVLITEGSWWARYVPYIYLIPILDLILLYISKKKISKIIGVMLSILMFINVGFIINTTFNTYKASYININKEMKNIKTISNKDGSINIMPYKKDFCSIVYNLKDKNIKYKIIYDKTKLKSNKYVNRFYY